jgi:O-methyltransferase involved in polyketide biosynthesis
VPETLLWALWHRAAYAEGPLAILPDPVAADLLRRIDYPFRAHFGAPRPWHALRAREADGLIRHHLARHPGAAVVTLGGGLETRFWRVSPGPGVRWITVELPEVVALRTRLLPADPARQDIAGSAADLAWLEAVPEGPPPLVEATGLLMYLDPGDVAAIIGGLFARFPAATLIFDTVPPGFAAQTREGLRVTPAWRAPPMPWGIAHDRIAPFVTGLVPGASVRVRTYADLAPWLAPAGWWAALVPWLRNALCPCLVVVEGPAAPRGGG